LYAAGIPAYHAAVSELDDHLARKRAAIRRLKAHALGPDYVPKQLSAVVTVPGTSGVRRIGVRDFRLLSDSLPEFAGEDLGPSAPELQLAALGACVAHTFLIQAAAHEVKLERLSVQVTARIDGRAGQPGFADVPRHPYDIAYSVEICSPAAPHELAALHAAVESTCPILNLLRTPQSITTRLHLVQS
jgi:uncharacterized OsmC-like protein